MISVIIPAYNAEKFIQHTIESVLNQSYKDFEVVVVNDGSSDSTRSIVEDMADKYGNIRLINQPNEGVSSARNTALKEARGEFFTMVDADDELPRDALKVLMSCMSDEVDLVIGSHYEIRFKRKRQGKRDTRIEKEELGTRFREFDSMVWTPWAKLFRKSVIDDYGVRYDKSVSYGEDHIFNLDFAENMTGAVVSTSQIVYDYHSIRSGLCSKFYPDMNQIQRVVLERVLEFISGVDLGDEDKKSLSTLYCCSYFRGLCDYYISWCPGNKAEEFIRISYFKWEDLLKDLERSSVLSDAEVSLLRQNRFREFIVCYTKNNPKRTIWRKAKRTFRRLLEVIAIKSPIDF